MISPNHKKMIAIGIVCFIMALAIGYSWGYGNAIEWMAGVAVHYLDFGELTTEELADALIKYKHHINSGT